MPCQCQWALYPSQQSKLDTKSELKMTPEEYKENMRTRLRENFSIDLISANTSIDPESFRPLLKDNIDITMNVEVLLDCKLVLGEDEVSRIVGEIVLKASRSK